ncbi:hypothetical protein KIW84_021394 [Lathyrus oleraceus]|uniref:Uncharacterized protein n=1 Tax=Pisum sativum TaxID=3888 RepID=A0A9D4Y9R4_PEA|nr:hypothetical protein KIW84_021394 [Pisum sativum]
MSYAELYPSLIDRKLIPPRDPPATKVQDLVRSGILFFEDVGPNVKKNPLPEHGKDAVNMVQGCPGKYKVIILEPVVVKYDGRRKKVSPSLVIKPTGPVPYSFDKAVPYRYNAVMLEDGKKVSLPSTSVVSILDVSGVTHSGRVFSVQSKPHEDVVRRTVVVNPAGPVEISSSTPVVKG